MFPQPYLTTASRTVAYSLVRVARRRLQTAALHETPTTPLSPPIFGDERKEILADGRRNADTICLRAQIHRIVDDLELAAESLEEFFPGTLGDNNYLITREKKILQMSSDIMCTRMFAQKNNSGQNFIEFLETIADIENAKEALVK